MKVCILTTSFPAYRGHFQSPFIHELAKSLAKNRIDVQVVCPFYKESKSKSENWDGAEIVRFQYFYPKSLQLLTSGGGIPSNLKSSFFCKLQLPFFMAAMFLKSRKYVKRCDVIHAQWALSGFIGVLLKKIYKKPLLITTRGADIDLAIKGGISKKILAYTLRNSDYVTPNNYRHEEILRELGVPKEKIIPIPNGVDTDSFKPHSKILARKKLRLPLRKKIILSIGWLIPRKGYSYLLEAVPQLIKKDKELLFIIIGEGIMKEELLRKARKLGVEKYVSFVGPKPPNEIPVWMNSSDIFILPSISEGRPNVVLEALASGLPVIATNVSGTSEFIRNKENGLLIKPKSSKEIEGAISLLLDNKMLMKKMTLNSRESVLSKDLSWEKCAKSYANIYKTAINNKFMK